MALLVERGWESFNWGRRLCVIPSIALIQHDVARSCSIGVLLLVLPAFSRRSSPHEPRSDPPIGRSEDETVGQGRWYPDRCSSNWALCRGCIDHRQAPSHWGRPNPRVVSPQHVPSGTEQLGSPIEGADNTHRHAQPYCEPDREFAGPTQAA